MFFARGMAQRPPHFFSLLVVSKSLPSRGTQHSPVDSVTLKINKGFTLDPAHPLPPPAPFSTSSSSSSSSSFYSSSTSASLLSAFIPGTYSGGRWVGEVMLVRRLVILLGGDTTPGGLLTFKRRV